MFLGEPLRSPYDWEFVLFNFHVRVTWMFWAISAAFGYEWARGLHNLYSDLNYQTPGTLALLAIWIAVCFVSILIHELGHTFAMRYFGIPSHIVLHGFGGLAIPEASYSSARRHRLTHLDNIIISAAGPAAQLVIGVLAAFIAFWSDHPLGQLGMFLDWVGIDLPPAYLFENAALTGLLDATLFTSIFWPVLNLIPILPLDGGRIAQHLIGWNNKSDGMYEATILSVFFCAVLGIYAFQSGQTMLAFFVIFLGMSNFQNLQGRF